MNRSSFGNWRSIFIWPRAFDPVPPLPRMRFSQAIAPVASVDMLNLPTRVSFTTSPADSMQIIASQWSRRAASAGSTARM